MESSSPSITPQRRPRADSASELGSTTFESATSQARKRPRLDDDISPHDHDHDDEEEDTSLLPDSYRRSPKGKGRAMDVLQEHHPGSIVRVTMKTFVTYTHAEFLPGPNLNMIIGPNGTGKSTLVCAICLGLGWKPEHLGRAKDIAEFVKHGAREATIEIELKADTEIHPTNPIITCVITREGGKSDDKKTTFKINGKKSTRKAVQELVKSNYSIQVDNLCQFLPQDRVVEFAALSPVDLLVQTQRAAAEDYMSEWHEQLKAMRKDQRQKQTDNQSLLETLKALEDRHKGQAEQVEKMRRKEESVARLRLLEKLRPVPEYALLAQRHNESKTRRDGAKRELAQLKDRVAPNLESMNQKKDYHDQLEKVVGHRSRLLGNTEKAVTEAGQKITSTDEEIKKCAEQATAERQGSARAKQSIIRHQNEIRDLERAIANPPEPFDPAEINQQVQEKTTEIRRLTEETDDTKSSLDSLRLQGQQRQQIIADLEERKNYLQSQAGKQSSALQKISRDSATAWDWIQDHRDDFSGAIYAPPMISCSIKDPSHAHHTNWVEAAIGEGDMKAFTVTNSEDFNKLTHQLQEVMRLKDITVRNSRSSLQNIKHPLSDQALKQIGLDGWVQDLLEGPEPVIAMLCDNRNLHIAAYAHKEITTQENQDAIVRTALTSWYTPTKSYVVARRRDLGKESTRSTFLNKAKCFIDAPVDTQAEQDINNKQSEARAEIEEIKTEVRGVTTRDKSLKQQIKKLQEEKQELSDSKSEKQKQKTLYQGLHTKLTNTQKKLEEAEAIVAAVYGRVDAIQQKEMNLAMQKGQQSLDYARLVCTLQKKREELFEVEIMRIEAQSDYEQFKSQNDEERKLLANRETEVERLTTVTRELKNEGLRLGQIVRGLVEELTEEEKEVHTTEIQGKMPEELETLIEAQKADIDMIGVTGGANTLKEYEDRAQKIEHKRAALQTLEVDLEKLDKEITDIRGQWEPQLDELIGQISDAFSENFSRIQCAGEVAIHKDEDFEQWAIQIKVKFRENESLSILDSHRQSGGERAVSTIFYLMALQTLARAPFRVVDEINQGMDPRNERLVHSRMVDIACAEHTAQYFLITPKLLNGLKYHKNMKVHCIASGEYMPSSAKGQALETFEEMAKRALAIRNAA